MNKIFAFGLLFAVTYHSFSMPVVNEVELSFYNSCHLCEEVVWVVSKDINVFNKTITDIIVVVRDICSDVPGPSGKECIYILDNIQQIMKWIVGGMTPSGVCHKLGLCNTTMHPLPCVDEL